MRKKLVAVGMTLVLTAGRAGADCGPYVPAPPAPPEQPAPPAGDNPEDPEDKGPQTPGGSPAGGPSTPGGGGGGPTTPGGGGGGPATGGPDAGPSSPGGDGGGGPTSGGGGGGRPAGGGGPSSGPTTPGAGGGPGDTRGGRTASLDRGHWSYWWLLNRASIVDLAPRGPVAARTPRAAQAPGREMWREEAHAALAAALSDPDARIVRDAVVAMGKARDPMDSLLLGALVVNQSRPLDVRMAAAISLGMLPAEDALSGSNTRRVLERTARLSDASPQLRAACLYALGMRRDPAAVPALAEFAGCGAPTWDIPAAALTALGLSGAPMAREELERLLATPKASRDQESMRRVYATHGLALLRDPASLPALRAAAADESEDVRRAAVLALGAVAPAGCGDTSRTLAGVLLRDKDRVVRGVAALSLGRVGGESAASALRRAQADNEASLRPYVALGLGLLARTNKDEAIAKSLERELVSGQQAELQGALCVALGLAGRAESAPALRAVVAEAKDPDVRGHAAVALGLVGDAGGFDAIRPLLDVQVPRLQGEAGLGLSLVATPGHVAALGELLAKDGQQGTQAAAAIALGRIGGQEAVKLLVATLRDANRPALTRRMAANGLGIALDASGGRATGRVAADLDWCALTATVVDFVNAQ